MVRRTSAFLLPAAAIAALAAGAVAMRVSGAPVANRIWLVALVVTGTPLLWRTLRDAGRGRFATDIVASLSIIGAILLQQPVAGLVIVLMQSGGALLEQLAEGRASAAVSALEAASPRIAHLMRADVVTDVPVGSIAVNDVVLVRPGEMVPCDGVIIAGRSDLNAAALTGEPLPIEGAPGTPLMSGTLNGAGLLRVRITKVAGESQYSRIVELVRNAQAAKAPVQRLADQYAVWFTPATLAVCAVAFAFTHDWLRVLAVLVVATPCPLILAAPIAVVGGINRAARRGIIMRNGNALEQLARVDTVAFDKTGTITLGLPQVQAVRAIGNNNRAAVLGYAAAVEQASGHLLARVTVAAAEDERIALAPVTDSSEEPGQGVAGMVTGHHVRVGGRKYVLANATVAPDTLEALERTPVALRAFVAIDGAVAGTIEYADEIRHDIPDTLERLHRGGIRRMLLLSGDHGPAVAAMAKSAGFTEAHGDMLPADKAAMVGRLRQEGAVVLMVGDGTNDAPALMAADAGVALSAHGGGVSTEAADVIILRDAFDRVADAVEISRFTIHVTRQSIWTGLVLSAVAMIFAAAGAITPTFGALLQEGIDVAVIINALRTSTPQGLS